MVDTSIYSTFQHLHEFFSISLVYKVYLYRGTMPKYISRKDEKQCFVKVRNIKVP